MIYVFLATGFEDIEALAPVDIMRRAGLEVETVSITDELTVVSSHGVGIQADTTLGKAELSKADMLVLPGGLPGSINLDGCKKLTDAITVHHNSGKALAAICAAPQVFGHLGILNGKRATCYPGVESELGGAIYTAAVVEKDGNIITGKGPGASFEFGYTIVDHFLGKGASEGLRQGMIYADLFK